MRHATALRPSARAPTRHSRCPPPLMRCPISPPLWPHCPSQVAAPGLAYPGRHQPAQTPRPARARRAHRRGPFRLGANGSPRSQNYTGCQGCQDLRTPPHHCPTASGSAVAVAPRLQDSVYFERCAAGCKIAAPTLPDGATVARLTLDQVVLVRIQVRQPALAPSAAAPSSSGLGHRPLKAETAGSNPAGATSLLLISRYCSSRASAWYTPAATARTGRLGAAKLRRCPGGMCARHSDRERA